jgi:hypothetical protein
MRICMVGPAVAAVNERAGRRALVWATALALLAVVLDFVPLFDVLGYDFSFAMGLAAALAAVDIGHGVVARWRSQAGTAPDAADAATLGRLAGTAVLVTLGALALPLLLSLANAFRVRNCNLGAGLAFFLLLPVGTALFAAPAGVLAGLLAPRRGRLCAFALPVVSLAWALWRLYDEPAVFAFDPFGGFFPGPIYDEALRPPLRLLQFRGANLVWIATALLIAAAALGRGRTPAGWRRRPLRWAAPLLIASGVLFACRGSLGFAVRRGDLTAVLDQTLRTEHFIVHYSGGKAPADLALQTEDLEFRYQQLVDTLGVEPAGLVTIWEFPNADVKKALVGAGHTLYAKPWTREIFLQSERFPSTRLRHELAHVFAGTFGDPLFGVAFTWRWKGPLPLPTLAMGLVEGLAEAADTSDPDGASTIHQDAAAMIADGRAPPLAAVVGAGFSTLSGARAYTLAGSFCAFLLETRGPERLRALYHSAGNFTDVYRTPLPNLEEEWRQFLGRQPLSPRDRARASEQFRRPAIFKKICARELAARLAEARGLERVAPALAVRLLEGACRDDPREPTFRLELAQARAFAGDRRTALELLGRLRADADVTQPLQAQGASLAAEIHFHERDFVNARIEEQHALELFTEDADRRLALAKLRALASPPARDTLGRALFGDAFGAGGADPVLTFFLMSEYARLHPTDPVGPYLLGRQLLPREPAFALPFLRRACEDDGPPAVAAAPADTQQDASRLPVEFARECRRMTAEAAYRLGDFQRARAALTDLAAAADTEAERLRALDMGARVEWAASRRRGVIGAAPSLLPRQP